MKQFLIFTLFLFNSIIGFSQKDTTLVVKGGLVLTKKDTGKVNQIPPKYEFAILEKPKTSSFDVKDYAILFTLVISIGAFLVNAYQLRKNIHWKKMEFDWKEKEFDWKKSEFDWKKSEFLAKEVNAFFCDENVKRALLMLDWNKIRIEMNESEKNTFEKMLKEPTANSFYFDDLILKSALRHHSEVEKQIGFTGEETIIRTIFDEFLRKLSMLNHYVDENLVNFGGIKSYLDYTVKLFCNTTNKPRKDAEILKQFWKYIVLYENEEIVKLCKKYGTDITKYN